MANFLQSFALVLMFFEGSCSAWPSWKCSGSQVFQNEMNRNQLDLVRPSMWKWIHHPSTKEEICDTFILFHPFILAQETQPLSLQEQSSVRNDPICRLSTTVVHLTTLTTELSPLPLPPPIVYFNFTMYLIILWRIKLDHNVFFLISCCIYLFQDECQQCQNEIFLF